MTNMSVMQACQLSAGNPADNCGRDEERPNPSCPKQSDPNSLLQRACRIRGASETLGECVRREVKKEVGIIVENIQYSGSQPWPFPNSLMIGFTAEYAAGEIQIDSEEISDAGWFDKASLPRIPRL